MEPISTQLLHDDRPLVRIWFLNVGQGDCTIVIDDDTKKALLIDCPTTHVARVKEVLDSESATLDTCIVTHWDADHYAGVARLAVALSASHVHYNHDTLFDGDDLPRFAIRGALQQFLDVDKPGDVLADARAGTGGTFGRVSWTLLAPNQYELTKAYVARRRNIASGVVDISVPSARILIGGDAVGATWLRLVNEFAIKADVLRWPHHGADLAGDASGAIRAEVMDAARPRYVIISAGTHNGYGHPSFEVIHGAAETASIMCSQVTAGCFGFLAKKDRQSSEAQEAVRALGDSSCADTVRMSCFPDYYSMSPSVFEHEARIDRWSAPMCRRRTVAGDFATASTAADSNV